MTSTWNGQYTYGEGYSEEIQGTSVAFILKMSDNSGEISGTCTDDEGDKLFTEPATFKGFIENDFISFIKKYPSYWEINEEGQTRIHEDISPLDIHYYGNYSDGTFSGEWEIEYEVMDNEEQWHPIACGGTWSMTKDDSAH